MTLVAEIHKISCGNCKIDTLITVLPNQLNCQFVSENEIPDMINLEMSRFICDCGREIVVPYTIISIGHPWDNDMENDLAEASQILYRLSMKVRSTEYPKL